jgi:hypothetical protein
MTNIGFGPRLRGRATRLLSVTRPPPLSVTLLLAFAAAGCGERATSPARPVPLTLEAHAVGGAAARFTVASLASASATDTIPVTFAQALLVVRDVRFVLGDDGDGGQARFHGPYVIDLLAGTAQTLDTELVLPGRYQRVQGHLQPLQDGDGPAAGHAALIGTTILLEGDIEGDAAGPFAYSARIDNEFMIRGDFTVEAERPATAFVVFELPRFLQGREGEFLDPRVAENDLEIRQAIRHAIKVGLDEDHDGAMDDGLSEVDD